MYEKKKKKETMSDKHEKLSAKSKIPASLRSEKERLQVIFDKAQEDIAWGQSSKSVNGAAERRDAVVPNLIRVKLLIRLLENTEAIFEELNEKDVDELITLAKQHLR